MQSCFIEWYGIGRMISTTNMLFASMFTTDDKLRCGRPKSVVRPARCDCANDVRCMRACSVMESFIRLNTPSSMGRLRLALRIVVEFWGVFSKFLSLNRPTFLPQCLLSKRRAVVGRDSMFDGEEELFCQGIRDVLRGKSPRFLCCRRFLLASVSICTRQRHELRSSWCEVRECAATLSHIHNLGCIEVSLCRCREVRCEENAESHVMLFVTLLC